MSSPAEALRALAPALAFLLAAVPLAALLDDLGFFEAAAEIVATRTSSVLGLWLLAAATTIVLNLDTTVVLLTPLYLRLARRTGVDPIPLVAIPLLLASLASSVLPVSNLTTLIASDTLGLSVGDVVSHLALPTVTAITVGWLAYRRRFPTRLSGPLAGTGSLAVARSAAATVVGLDHDGEGSNRGDGSDRNGRGHPVDQVVVVDEAARRALRVGGGIVVLVLIGFTAGPAFGVEAWTVALVANAVLMVVTRRLPWRRVPVLTAVGIAGLGVAVAVLVPGNLLDRLMSHDTPLALVGITAVAAAAANGVNNLPALLVSLGGGSATGADWAQWAWLLGVNVGAVLLPLGAIANLLWLRILRVEGVTVGLRRYVSVTLPVAVPALAAATVVLALERLLT